jgi:hypothetical protein
MHMKFWRVSGTVLLLVNLVIYYKKIRKWVWQVLQMMVPDMNKLIIARSNIVKLFRE